MPLPPYSSKGPVDCSVQPDLSQLKGKSVVITGGANGLGETYARTFAANGAYVTFGDINVEKGAQVEKDLAPNAKFIKCNTTIWEDQLALFKSAITESPSKSVDIVIANAGITGADPLFTFEDPSSEPTKPSLRIIETNIIGVIYTFKLGMHYFRAQPEAEDRDRCFIFKGSIAGILDQPGSYQYSTSKFGLKGLMRSVRRTSWQEGIRVNYVAPWYTKTTILSPQVIERLESKGVEFSTPADCAAAMLRISCDKSINGRALSIVPRSVSQNGYIDFDEEDFKEGTTLSDLQTLALNASIRTVIPAAEQLGSSMQSFKHLN